VWACDGLIPAYFYEPITDYDDVVRVLSLQHELRARGVPEHLVPGLTVGFEFFDGGFYSDGQLELPAADELFRGRHSVALVGYTKCAESLTSWDPRWGDGGHSYIDRDYFDAHCEYVSVERSSVAGPSSAMFDKMEAASRTMTPHDQFVTSWMTPNRFWQRDMLINRIRATLLMSFTGSGRSVTTARFVNCSSSPSCAVAATAVCF
jgi:hypothetical protein